MSTMLANELSTLNQQVIEKSALVTKGVPNEIWTQIFRLAQPARLAWTDFLLPLGGVSKRWKSLTDLLISQNYPECLESKNPVSALRITHQQTPITTFVETTNNRAAVQYALRLTTLTSLRLTKVDANFLTPSSSLDCLIVNGEIENLHQLSKLTSLRTLAAMRIETDLSVLGNLTTLTSLEFYQRAGHKEPLDLSRLTDLRTLRALSLSEVYLGSLPVSLTSLTHRSDNYTGSDLPENLNSLNKLTNLVRLKTGYRTENPRPFDALTNLTRLKFRYYPGKEVICLTSLTKLRRVHINSSRYNGPVELPPSAVDLYYFANLCEGHVQGFLHLEKLSCFGISDCISRLTQLTDLEVWGGVVPDHVLIRLGELPKLRKLRADTRMDDNEVKKLLPNVEHTRNTEYEEYEMSDGGY